MSILLALALLHSGPLSVPLGDGNTLVLSYLSDAPQRRSWRPDGTPAPSYLIDRQSRSVEALDTGLKDGDLEAVLTLQMKRRPSDMSTPHGPRYLWQPTFGQVDPTSSSRYGIASGGIRLGKNIFSCRRIFPKPASNKPFSLTVKVADTEWNTVGKAYFRRETKIKGDAFIAAPTFLAGVSKKLGKSFPLHIPAQWNNCDVRLISFDAAGNFYPSGGEMTIKDGQKFIWFTCPTKEITRINLETRPFKTVVFKGIQPHPKA